MIECFYLKTEFKSAAGFVEMSADKISGFDLKTHLKLEREISDNLDGKSSSPVHSLIRLFHSLTLNCKTLNTFSIETEKILILKLSNGKLLLLIEKFMNKK